MRKPIPKSVRKLVYAKYNGHCAYCGCEIPEKGFNVDHLHCLRNYEYTEEFTGIDVHDIGNLMPSCGSCNRYKATMDLETFRKQLLDTYSIRSYAYPKHFSVVPWGNFHVRLHRNNNNQNVPMFPGHTGCRPDR